jgi:chemotaxis protein methyltransferase WspC
VASVFETLLNETMGLNPAAVSSDSISRAVRERMATCGLVDEVAYSALARRSPRELQALIETVAVPESWFFRDPNAFAEMTRAAVELSSPGDQPAVLRLLSLPCSTGEEPYSMAMSLLDAGFRPGRFRIDAVDISSRSLAFAGRAIYGGDSFRSKVLNFRSRHFEATEHGYRLSDAVRATVGFAQGNVLAAGFTQELGTYDVIFCRNLLVYLDRAAQERAIEVLRHLLVPGGILWVGSAEAGLMFAHGFISTKGPSAFCLP